MIQTIPVDKDTATHRGKKTMKAKQIGEMERPGLLSFSCHSVTSSLVWAWQRQRHRIEKLYHEIRSQFHEVTWTIPVAYSHRIRVCTACSVCNSWYTAEQELTLTSCAAALQHSATDSHISVWTTTTRNDQCAIACGAIAEASRSLKAIKKCVNHQFSRQNCRNSNLLWQKCCI